MWPRDIAIERRLAKFCPGALCGDRHVDKGNEEHQLTATAILPCLSSTTASIREAMARRSRDRDDEEEQCVGVVSAVCLFCARLLRRCPV